MDLQIDVSISSSSRSLAARSFLWDGDRNAALGQARRSGCALEVWFKLAQAREQCRQEFITWLKDLHARYGARFGKVAAAASR